jgi:hypothetical protein
MNDDVQGRPTSLLVTNVDDPARWTVTGDDGMVACRPVERGLELRFPIGRHELTLGPA